MKSNSNAKLFSVVLIAVFIFSLFPLQAADVFAANVCDTCYTNDGICSASECEGELGCLWCESSSCDQMCPCVPKSQGCTGYGVGVNCQYDEQCASNLHCSGRKGGSVFEQACCPDGKEWNIQTRSCGEPGDLEYPSYADAPYFSTFPINPVNPSPNNNPSPVQYICRPGSCVGKDSNCDGKPDAICSAQPEVCDGIDNDKDGVVDDGVCSQDCYSCGKGVWNVCDKAECEGLGKCSFSKNWVGGDCKPAPNPPVCIPEVLNGVDDDCDGLVDEGLNIPSESFIDGSQDALCIKDRCWNGDNDCDGIPDIGCQSPACLVASKEICDRKDNDCDGVIDDDCGSCNMCGKGTINICDKKECESLGPGCVFHLGFFYNSCTESISGMPANFVEEVCNGIDDDGDKAVDENCYPEPYNEINSKPTFEEIVNNLRNKECKDTSDCGGILICTQAGYKNVCCLPKETGIAGRCFETLKADKGGCNENSECRSGYCSKGVQSYDASMLKPINNFIGVLTPDDSNFKAGKCCPPGTDYDSAEKECIEGGTFTKKGDSDYCKEKQMKGYACEDGEGNCNYDTECREGSYCADSFWGSICCQKGTILKGGKCVENPAKECAECQNDGRCTETECVGISAKCTFDASLSKCYEKSSLAHDEGDCNTGLACSAAGEVLECSVYLNYGVCCYPWEQQNSKTRRCQTKCASEFCDLDSDYFSSEIEMRYGANPSIKEDTPLRRFIIFECDSPFDYLKYSNPGFLLKSIFEQTLPFVFGVPGLAVDRLYKLIKGSEVQKTLFQDAGIFVGVYSGAIYGLMDDINFAGSIAYTASPMGISERILELSRKQNEVKSRNPEFEKQIEPESYEIDSSIRNSIFSGISNMAYESYDDMFKKSVMSKIFRIFKPEECEAAGNCYKMVYTKSFTSGFMGGYVIEQALLLGKIGGFLIKAAGTGASAAAKTLRIAGKTFQFIDNPLKYMVFDPIGELIQHQKLFNKFGEEGTKIIFKGGEKEAANALELSKIISKTPLWKTIDANQFKTLLDNFIDLKNQLAKVVGDDSSAILAANDLIKTSLGQKIVMQGVGKGKWSASSVYELLQQMHRQSFKQVDEAFGVLDSEAVARFGKELSELEQAASKEMINSMFKKSSLADVLKQFNSGAKLSTILASLSDSADYFIKNNKWGIEYVQDAALKAADGKRIPLFRGIALKSEASPNVFDSFSWSQITSGASLKPHNEFAKSTDIVDHINSGGFSKVTKFTSATSDLNKGIAAGFHHARLGDGGYEIAVAVIDKRYSVVIDGLASIKKIPSNLVDSEVKAAMDFAKIWDERLIYNGNVISDIVGWYKIKIPKSVEKELFEYSGKTAKFKDFTKYIDTFISNPKYAGDASEWKHVTGAFSSAEKVADDVADPAATKSLKEFDNSFRGITYVDNVISKAGGDSILKGLAKDYPYLSNIKKNLEKFGVTLEEGYVRPGLEAVYNPSTKKIIFDDKTTVSGLMHELRHFSQDRARGFVSDNFAGIYTEILIKMRKSFPSLLGSDEQMLLKQIETFKIKASKEEKEAILKYLDEVDAYDYTRDFMRSLGADVPSAYSTQQLKNLEGAANILAKYPISK